MQEHFTSRMIKVVDSVLVAAMLFTSIPAMAEQSNAQTSPEKPSQTEMGTPPDGFGGGEMGTPPDGQPGGSEMGTPPDGQPGGGEMGTPPDGQPGGGMGGMSGSAPESYTAVTTISEDTVLESTEVISTGTDENAVLVTSGNVSMTGATITRTSEDSAGGDQSSFYGVGAAVLVTGGELTITDSTITTDAAGGAGVFAYGDGVATVSNTTIITTQNTSGGIHVAGGGTLYANDCTVVTEGESAAAIRSDRGSGTMVVNGGSYVSHGLGSPAVYVTADITITDADLAATGSEAVCLEGLNSLKLVDCRLEGNMLDQEQNDNTWTVILYQSMSGDSAVGKGTFSMTGGTLVSGNGGLFYTTNTESEFTLENVEILAADDAEYFLRVTGNSNQRGWGQSGSNGADCVFTAIQQVMDGDILWDSISTLTLNVTEGSTLTGAILDDETNAGNGGSGWCNVTIDASSAWVVTADSRVSSLACAGTLTDATGAAVKVVGTDGTVYVQGDSYVTVTVDSYTSEI